MTVRDRIFDLMKKQRITQRQMAKAIGISEQSISGWKLEGDKEIKSYMNFLPQIAEVLGVPVSVLVQDCDPEADPLDGLRFALYGDPAKDVTEEDLQDVKDFAAYVRQRRKEKK